MLKLEDRLKFSAEYICNVLRLFAPKDSSNLSTNGIRIVYVAPNQYDIFIGGETANYALFTNEKWISPKWKGKQNPNENWIQQALEFCQPMVIIIMSGAISEEDVILTLGSQKTVLFEQVRDLANEK